VRAASGAPVAAVHIRLRLSDGASVPTEAHNHISNLRNLSDAQPRVGAVFDESGKPVPSAGLITSTQTTSRQVQLAMKVIW
jgi:hypothetical protein